MGNEGGVVRDDKEVVFGCGGIGGPAGLPAEMEKFWRGGESLAWRSERWR